LAVDFDGSKKSQNSCSNYFRGGELMKLTLSVIKADIGGYVGHSESHPDILADACEGMDKAKREGLLIDYHVTK
jgi:hypothetical protein